jgi:hypothetical protein
MAALIITNGDSAAELLAAAGVDGTILPWRDVLHDGPIVGGGIETCSARRAPYLATRFGLDEADIGAAFAERDRLVRGHAGFDRIELWFEHDLYDQLQLVQVLSCLADEDRSEGVMLVQADDFLGNQTAASILRFAGFARPVTNDDLDLAAAVWADLAMPTPEAAARWIEEETEPLPFLAPALHRFLEELPAPGSGLGRTEATALAVLAGGTRKAADLFRAVIAGEEAPFMGDMSFFALLGDLARAEIPLIAIGARARHEPTPSTPAAEADIALTGTGRAVLADEADHVQLNGVDRWWGGTRLEGHHVWRYDRDSMALVPPQATAA